MRDFRRFLLLCVLLFWQGGFTFYTAVVIPVGAQALGSHRLQAVITREVATYLNIAGVAALPVMVWDVWAEKDPQGRRRRWRWGLLLAQLLTLGSLFWLQTILNAQVPPAGGEITQPAAFRLNHRVYVWINTVQWACSLGFLLLSLRAWTQKEHTPVPIATTQRIV